MNSTIKQISLLVMFMVGMTAVAVAQNLTGNVIDDKGEAVPFAGVTLLDADSAYVAGTTTDEAGKFDLPHSRRAALLRASCVGYRTTTIPVTASPMTVTLPEDGVTLQAVEVVSMRKLVKNEADRLSYNMNADPEARTTTLLEMLRKVPMVSVDAEDNVLVRGSKSFKFYKNGHPDPTLADATTARDVLRSIPANTIERVEVITEPGAKYDAEGATVILNIVTVRGSSTTGLNGTVSAGVNNHGAVNGSLQLAGSTGKLSISGNLGGYVASSHAYPTESEVDHTYLTNNTRQYTESSHHVGTATIYGQLNASYEIDTLNLLTASYSQFLWHARPSGVSVTEYYDSTGTLYSQAEVLTGKKVGDGKDDTRTGGAISARLDYEHRTHRKDEVITASYMFSRDYDNSDTHNAIGSSINPQVPYTAFDSHTKGYTNEHTLQLDYQLPLWTKHRMETGLKYIHRRNHSHTTTSYAGAEWMDLDDEFTHTTQVAAAYLSWLYTTGPVSLRAGARYEFSRLSAHFTQNPSQDFHSSLNDLVPSFTANWQINPSNSLRLSYSTSINRPGITYLNPTVVQTLTHRNYGNPNLSSARNHSLGLTYSFLSNKFTFNLSPSVEITRNMIDMLTFVDDEGFQVYTYGNGNRRVNFDFNAFMQWMPTRKTTVMLNGSAGHTYLKNPSLNLRNSGWEGFIFAQLTQELFWKIRGNVSLVWWGIGHVPTGLYGYYHVDRPTLGFSLRRSFLDDRLTVSLRAEDITHSRLRFVVESTKGDILGYSNNWNLRRTFSLNLSFRFGKSQTNVKQTATTIENNDQIGGIQSGSSN